MKRILLLFTIFVCLSAPSKINAQVGGVNAGKEMKNVQVDDMSDAQIKGYYEEMKKRHISESQMPTLLAQKGMSPIEIKKLQARIKGLNTAQSPRIPEIPLSEKTDYDTKAVELPISKSEKDTTLKEYFGADFFQTPSGNNAGYEQASSSKSTLATPAGYMMGVQDVLSIDVSGFQEMSDFAEVNGDGNILLRGIGSINVAGLSFEMTKKKIQKMLIGAGYRTLENGKSKLSIHLETLKTIQVNIIGEVAQPGTYSLSSLSSIFDALYACKGPNVNGSLRKIELIRNNKIITTLDAYDFLMNGITSSNLILQHNDVIRVPFVSHRVRITGEVNRSKYYEILPQDRLSTLILTYALGYKINALETSAQITRIASNNITTIDVDTKDFQKTELKNGDYILVRKRTPVNANCVSISGPILFEGSYELNKTMNISQLIEKAGGLKTDAYLERALLIRTNPDSSKHSIAFNIKNILNKTDEDINLQNRDQIFLISTYALRTQSSVSVQGEVNEPKTIEFVDSLRLKDVLLLAGGFSKNSLPQRIEISRRTFNSTSRKDDINIAQVLMVENASSLNFSGAETVLAPNDVITISSNPRNYSYKSVGVMGEVLFPGKYSIGSKQDG